MKDWGKKRVRIAKKMAKKEKKVNPSGKRRERGRQALSDFVDEGEHIYSRTAVL